MSKRFRWFTLLACITFSATAAAAPFTPGSVVVYRIGDGSRQLEATGNPVFLDEYSPSGELRQSIALPTTVLGSNRPLIAGTNTDEGRLTRSYNRRQLVLTGYATNLGGVSNLAETSSGDIPRTIGIVNASGVVNTATALADIGHGSPRSVASTDGVEFWVADGTGNVRAGRAGTATSSLLAAPSETNQLYIFGAQLYAAHGLRGATTAGNVRVIASTENDLPMADTPSLPMLGTPAGMVALDLSTKIPGVDTVYVADEFFGLIQKFSLRDRAGIKSWQVDGTISVPGIRALTATVDTVSYQEGIQVALYATAEDSQGRSVLYQALDYSGYQGVPTASLNVIAQANQNTAFRGVAQAPDNIVRIRDIQGTRHKSLFDRANVTNVPGMVTRVVSQAFFMQDTDGGDGDERTSEGLFVFRPNTQPSLGHRIRLSGQVQEFYNPTYLSLTEIAGNPSWVSDGGLAFRFPEPVTIGKNGRKPPRGAIYQSDRQIQFGLGEGFNPKLDLDRNGMDFYESLEGMLVQVDNPKAVRGTDGFTTSGNNSYREIVIVPDAGEGTVSTNRGGVIVRPGSFNPERITLLSYANEWREIEAIANVGDLLTMRGYQNERSFIIGVFWYNFTNYALVPFDNVVKYQDSRLTAERTELVATPTQLTVASYNVENLSNQAPPERFNAIAGQIVENLRSPDIIALSEMQDWDGEAGGNCLYYDPRYTVPPFVYDLQSAYAPGAPTFRSLTLAIVRMGGPEYAFAQIDPRCNNSDGGAPWGHIRVGFLYRPDRVNFVERAVPIDVPRSTYPHNTSNEIVSGENGKPQLRYNPGRVNPQSGAWELSRKPLAAEFEFNGESIFLIANHLKSKGGSGGDDRLFGSRQPPFLGSESQRRQQAIELRNFSQEILNIDPNAKVVVLGDLNDYEFSPPLLAMQATEPPLHFMINDLPPQERYSYNFEGNAQALDHIVISQGLRLLGTEYDIVHANSEFYEGINPIEAPRLKQSDHDPNVARLNFSTRNYPPSIAVPSGLRIERSLSQAQGGSQRVIIDVNDDQTPADMVLLSVVSGNADLLPTERIRLVRQSSGRHVMTIPAVAKAGYTQLTLIATDSNGAQQITNIDYHVQPEQ